MVMSERCGSSREKKKRKKESWMSNSVEIPQENYSPSTDMSSIICAAAHVINGRFNKAGRWRFQFAQKTKQNSISQIKDGDLRNKKKICAAKSRTERPSTVHAV